MQKNTGFTLIELLVVVLIIGILSALALPQYTKAVEKSRAVEAIVTVKAVRDAAELYFMTNGNYPSSLDDLDVSVQTPKDFRWDLPNEWNTGRFSLRRKNSLDYQIIFSGYTRTPTAFDPTALRGKLYCTSEVEAGKKICRSVGSMRVDVRFGNYEFWLI